MRAHDTNQRFCCMKLRFAWIWCFPSKCMFIAYPYNYECGSKANLKHTKNLLFFKRGLWQACLAVSSASGRPIHIHMLFVLVNMQFIQNHIDWYTLLVLEGQFYCPCRRRGARKGEGERERGWMGRGTHKKTRQSPNILNQNPAYSATVAASN